VDAGGLIILVAMFALLWVLFIMPQRKRLAAQRQLHASLQPGDEVLTVGGVLGRIRSVDEDDVLHVEIAPGTTVRVARQGVASVIRPEGENPPRGETPS
jgi:preprotein translocase subunit YajC